MPVQDVWMNSRTVSPSCVFVVLACTACASTPNAPKPVHWPLSDVENIGGHATEVLGTPKIESVHAETAIVFDGRGDGILVPANPLAGWSRFTIEVRFRPDGSGAEEQRFLHLEDDLDRRVLIETRVRNRQWALDTFMFRDKDRKLTLLDRARVHPTDQWYWVALVFDGMRMTSYVDGVRELEGIVSFTPMITGRTSIGVRQNRVSWFKGSISQVRFTPRALTSKQLQSKP